MQPRHIVMKAVVLLWRNWIKFIDPVRCFEKTNRKIRTLQAVPSDGDGKIDSQKRPQNMIPSASFLLPATSLSFYVFGF